MLNKCWRKIDYMIINMYVLGYFCMYFIFKCVKVNLFKYCIGVIFSNF